MTTHLVRIIVFLVLSLIFCVSDNMFNANAASKCRSKCSSGKVIYGGVRSPKKRKKTKVSNTAKKREQAIQKQFKLLDDIHKKQHKLLTAKLSAYQKSQLRKGISHDFKQLNRKIVNSDRFPYGKQMEDVHLFILEYRNKPDNNAHDLPDVEILKKIQKLQFNFFNSNKSAIK